MSVITRSGPFLCLVALFAGALPACGQGPRIDVEGFEQILPRGRIAALVDPEFVSAEKANIPKSAWVLGFEHGGEAYAYDLNLLNAHEVVNHRAGDQPIAAVW